MIKIALVQVLETTHVLGYGDDGYDTYRHFEGLDFQEVTEEELAEYVEAARLYNSKVKSTGKGLAIIRQLDQSEKVSLFSDLTKFRKQEQLRLDAMAKAEAARKAAAEDKKRQAKLRKTAKELGISVEALLAIQAEVAKTSS